MSYRQRLVLAALVLGASLVAPPAQAFQLRFPVDNAGGTAIWTAWVIGVDHDPAADPDGNDNCLNYAGLLNFPFCYDAHTGTDYLLNNGFTAMDNGSAFVVAAADGVVVHVEDGHYDRCHVDLQSNGRISCDGNPVTANYIEIDHGDGFVTLYYHLMKNSMLVEDGDSVTCGQAIARIGSSGISSRPPPALPIRGRRQGRRPLRRPREPTRELLGSAGRRLRPARRVLRGGDHPGRGRPRTGARGRRRTCEHRRRRSGPPDGGPLRPVRPPHRRRSPRAPGGLLRR